MADLDTSWENWKAWVNYIRKEVPHWEVLNNSEWLNIRGIFNTHGLNLEIISSLQMFTNSMFYYRVRNLEKNWDWVIPETHSPESISKLTRPQLELF